ncbi:replication initiator protein A [Staphylococcus epidermidis]|nr:replication initiator protein A [Staphylococcus epidermidis]MCG1279504.1 replication initiator protein A [Staphylococcus epidermidis]MCG1894350.1 replication initiator protein A [Staphylococcus epidermidis]
MSNDAKITWSILRDRLDLSIRNNWIDKNGDIFFIYTNEKLKSILNISNPNKLYIKRPEVTEADIYYISKRENNIEDRYNKEAGTLCPRLNYCYPMKLLKLIHYFKIVFNFIIALITLLFRSCRIIFDFLFFKYLM